MAAWLTTKGIDFRESTAYVTDPANCVVCRGSNSGSPQDNYPTSAVVGGDSITYGFTSTDGDVGRDRSTLIDARLAGVCQRANGPGGQDLWRLDLDGPGSHDIGMALGDAINATVGSVEVWDDTNFLFTVSGSPAAGQFLDANGVDWSAAAWPGSNTLKTVTFASSILILKIASLVIGGSTGFAHVSVSPFTAASGKSSQFALMGVG